ncbi:GNAT family N-acetyltransferase [Pelotomaculum propionicicum]|uniref:N-acetyltransferase domain-containing protein n=1 Tax=Pelotomaculum propionicicum TaxID=258475 RepID=A0A4Y7RU14_9FIRM|nr:GNAT family N-acetyltransferase [Pelotomaculum propionicicum]NLI12824.1 hypothetical protein [Peptococcaceae bacterium]TEB12246.1 hypothetical protein Pmgp_01137 [Pelotomaculum propionicicum]
MSFEVIEASSPEAVHAFNSFPRKIYRNFYMAPPFPVLVRSNPHYDPLFERVEAMPFLAVRKGRVLGRIAASVNHALADTEAGFFGFFETLQDAAVAGGLVEAAASWLSNRGKKKMIGPVDLSPHERLGLLIEGFGGYHNPGMPYNHAYYPSLLDQCGLEKEINLNAYHYDLRRQAPGRLARVAQRASKSKGIRIREIDFNNLNREGEAFSLIHNGSMHEIWGYAHLSPLEGAAIWKKLKNLFDPRLILFAEVNGAPAGICLAMCPVRRNVFISQASDLNARLAILAVLPEYRFKGIEAALIMECVRRARARGIAALELSLIAENNAMMNTIINNLDGVRKSRSYTIYRKNISPA